MLQVSGLRIMCTLMMFSLVYSSCRKTNRHQSTAKDLFTAEKTDQGQLYYWTYLAGEKQEVLCDARCRDGFRPITNPPPSVADRLANCREQIRSIWLKSASIPPLLDKYLRNPAETGGSPSATVRAQVEAIFSAGLKVGPEAESTESVHDIVDLNQSADAIVELGSSLSKACSNPASGGVLAATPIADKSEAAPESSENDNRFNMDSQVWLDVYTDYNTRVEGHKVHSYELRRFGGVNDDGSYRWEGLAPKTRYFEIIILGQDRAEHRPTGSSVSFRRKDLVEIIDPSVNKVLYIGNIVGLSDSHAIIHIPDSYAEAVGASNLDDKQQVAISWTSPVRKIRKASLKNMDSKAQEAITGTCQIVCEYHSQNFLSGNYFYVWKKEDHCNPGFRCGANTLGIKEGEHCAKAYHGVSHNVLPRSLGCFQ